MVSSELNYLFPSGREGYEYAAKYKILAGFFFFFLNEIIQILVRRLINSYFAFVMHPYNVFLMTSKAG